MPGAQVLIERYYRDRAAGLVAGRTQDQPSIVQELSADHASGLRTACADLTRELRLHCALRILSTQPPRNGDA